MTKLTLTEQEELFAKDCKLINLRYEYTNYTGKEKWGLLPNLPKKGFGKNIPTSLKDTRLLFYFLWLKVK